MDNLTSPHVNFNGNSKYELATEISNIWKGFRPLIETISKSEYDNGEIQQIKNII